MVLGPGYHCPLPSREDYLLTLNNGVGALVCLFLASVRLRHTYLHPGAEPVSRRRGLEGESGMAEGAGPARGGAATS